jgi:hypothetical protein
MAFLDACDSSASNQLDIAPVRAVALFAALASLPPVGVNERRPSAVVMQQAWDQLMKCIRLDKLIPSQSIAATRCGILGITHLVARFVLPLNHKCDGSSDGITVSKFLLQFLEPSTPPLVSQTACFAIGRLIAVEKKSTLLLPLIAAGSLSTNSGVRQAGERALQRHAMQSTILVTRATCPHASAMAAFRALLECDPALQTLVGLPYFKECSREHVR